MIKLDRYTFFVAADIADALESNLEVREMGPSEIPGLDPAVRCFEIYAFRGILRRRRIAKELRELTRPLRSLSVSPGEHLVIYRESIEQIAPERGLHA